MNDSRGCARLVRASAKVGLALCLPIVAGCENPFGTSASDLGPRAGPERLRNIGTIRLEDSASPVQNPSAPPDEPPADPYAGMERYPLSIEQARVFTLKNNLDLQVALVSPTIQRERLSEEEARFESVFTARARWAEFDQPASSSLNNNNARSVEFSPGVRIPLRTGGTATVELPLNYLRTDNQFSTPTTYENDVRLSLSQPLLRNAGRRANTYPIRIAALDTQIAEARAKLEVIRQLANVDRAYWRLYSARRQLEVRQDQYDLAKNQLEQAQRRVRAQVAPEVEVIRAQSGLAERIEAIIRADNLVRDRQRELKRIMNEPGLDIGTAVLIESQTEPDPVAFELSPERLADQAVSDRMEVLELELQLAQDYSTIDFERNQALPLFTLDYTYNVNGLGTTYTGSTESLRENDFSDWSLQANFEVPIGNEAGEARIHQAILRRLQRLSTKEAREQSIRQEVYNSVDNLDAAWQRILAARQAVILADRTLRAEQKQFDVGARTSTDVLDAATRLADAQSSEILALTDYQIAQVDLAFATGTILGAAKIEWEPRDPRGPNDFVGERRGRVPLGPPGILPKTAELERTATPPATHPAPRPPARPGLADPMAPAPADDRAPDAQDAPAVEPGMQPPADPPSGHTGS
ncbi:MAG: TolC family protein [Planctomycetota bacterium]|nr:TolC family protein [Planctomycetota bacterium]